MAVTVDGETVVDLWGGWADADRRTPWEKDTRRRRHVVHEGRDRAVRAPAGRAGELDFDAPVARYWPEFADAASTLVRHLLTHQAGLPALRTPLEPGAFYDWDPVVEALAAEAPFWEPGTAYGYHGLTFGFLVGEVVRRVTGAASATFFRREVAGPLGLDLPIGLPESEHGRVSHLNPAPPPAPSDPVAAVPAAGDDRPDVGPGLMMLNTGGYLVPEEWDSPAALVGRAAGHRRRRQRPLAGRDVPRDRARPRVGRSARRTSPAWARCSRR